jgi:phosphopantothenoylcysteine decarboxylase/phosphopantothenate--cysteine ligase
MLDGKRILLIISGGIAAYKSLELIRRLGERGAAVRCVMTAAAQRFVTPLSAAALSHDKVYTDLWSLTDESEMGHLRLAQEADLVVVAPASADLLARMAAGLADDLASTLLLATDKPVLVAPAMNWRMWQHDATQANLATLTRRGIGRVGPSAGALAEGESGIGRMAEPLEIVAAIAGRLAEGVSLRGRRVLVTSGPTHEAIDPVRYIANRSSGRQGHAIAEALARRGAATLLVSGPTALSDPPGVEVRHIESAEEMLQASLACLPVDAAICAAAVSDWRPADPAARKVKKRRGEGPPALALVENPDVLARLSAPGNQRPRLVVGFAAETENLVDNAKAKRLAKQCDWILANDVGPGTGTFGGEQNTVHLVTAAGVESWPTLSKREVAERLADRVAGQLAEPGP